MGLHYAVLGNSLFRLHQWPESNGPITSGGPISENDFQSVIFKSYKCISCSRSYHTENP